MSQSSISRRQLLKVLAAAAGTAVLSSVPNKWKTPVVDVGMLPAHAQTLSGRGAIKVTVTTLTAPIRNPKAPASCSFADVTIPTLSLEHCFDFPGGTYTFTNIPPGNYIVYCNFPDTCPPPMQDNITVVAGQTATANFDVPGC
jgi:hypothetical protein